MVVGSIQRVGVGSVGRVAMDGGHGMVDGRGMVVVVDGVDCGFQLTGPGRE